MTADPPSDLPRIPEIENEYVLVRELGRGGTAIVYLARDRELSRDVAIKLIRPAYVTDDDAIARLEREAHTVARMQHPNIVMLLGTRRLGDRGLALILQYVPGRTLKDLLQEEGALPPARAEAILTDVARALAYAHRRRIVHRDIKPENVYLDEDAGVARLADFGIARAWDSDSGLTLPGTALGTPSYMSPEQLEGEDLDGRSDVYSFGLLGFEVLTGHRPWDGESLYSIIYKQKHEKLPDLAELRPDAPPHLLRVLARALEKKPDDRWNDGTALLRALLDPTHPSASAVPAPGTSAPVPPGDPVPSEPPAPAWPPPELIARMRAATPPGQPHTEPAPPATPGALQQAGDSGAREEGSGDTPFLPAEAVPGTAPPFESDRAPVSRNRSVLAGLALAVLLLLGVGVAAVVGGPDGQVRTLLGQIMAGSDPIPADPLENEPFGAWRDLWGDPSPDGPTDPESVTAAVDPTSPDTTGGVPDTTGGIPDTAGVEESAASGVPAALQRAAPARQAGEVDTPLPQPLSVRLMDGVGVPIPDRWVHFRVASGGGTLSADSVLTTAGGMAAVAWTLGSVEGDQRVVAFLPDEEGISTVFDVAASLPSLGIRSGVAAGGTHSCTLRSNGQITCWGDNGRGQLGLSGGRRLTPGAPLAGGPWARLTSGVAHSCALTQLGSAFCWGANDRGQLGTGDTTPRSAPSEVAGEHLFREITAGAAHSCGVRMDGAVLCWGDNGRGQLGTGSTAASSVPATVSGTGRFRSVAAGWNHTCAIDSGGAAYCWGSNASGELGTGQSAASASSPQRVQGGGTFQEVSAGNAHTCARAGAGEVRCWGDNGAGQLGDGSREARRTPVAVMGGGRFTSVVAGAVHTCAVNEGGGAVCWGRNIYGQLGDGSTQDRTTPTTVEGAVRFQRLHAIGSHTCGQTPGGDLLCWGYNAEGQLGDGTRENRTRPVAVSGEDR